ncbi:MAG: hypothetical protein JWO60_2033 [Frankiales bacterium]|nr:hypothetical protein [Frankiales bacterium]
MRADGERQRGPFVNDFDLRVVSGESSAASQAVNPQEREAREQTALGGVGHCAKVVASVQNYLAGPDSLVLALTPTVEEPLEEE